MRLASTAAQTNVHIEAKKQERRRDEFVTRDLLDNLEENFLTVGRCSVPTVISTADTVYSFLIVYVTSELGLPVAHSSTIVSCIFIYLWAVRPSGEFRVLYQMEL